MCCRYVRFSIGPVHRGVVGIRGARPPSSRAFLVLGQYTEASLRPRAPVHRRHVPFQYWTNRMSFWDSDTHLILKWGFLKDPPPTVVVETRGCHWRACQVRACHIPASMGSSLVILSLRVWLSLVVGAPGCHPFVGPLDGSLSCRSVTSPVPSAR